MKKTKQIALHISNIERDHQQVVLHGVINLMLLDLHCPVKRHFVHGTIGTPLLDFISISVSGFFFVINQPSFLSMLLSFSRKATCFCCILSPLYMSSSKT